MRFAADWTVAMAIAIASFGVLLCGIGLGGGVIAWLVSLPVVFVGIHAIGIPVVLLTEIAEKIGIVPFRLRALAHEWLLVSVLLLIGWLILAEPVALGATEFFAVMFVLRVLFSRCWKPGEPLEIAPR